MLVLTLPPSGPTEAARDEMVVVVIILDESPATTPVLLYSVNSMMPPCASMICLLANREGDEEDETLPPHFSVGSPGQVVLHAEAGYSTKSSDESLETGRL